MTAESFGRRRNARTAPGVLLIVLTALACSGMPTGPSGDGYRKELKANDAAREKLVFGMSRAEVVAVMGTPRMVPPWANARKIGRQVVENPFDTLEFEAPNGDRYEVHRYAVGLHGEYRCPFIRGEAEFVPLIFFEGELVGWRWSYLASALQRRLTHEEERWTFGEFCGADASQANP
jgi:hypothetical protein